jgi:hypothetical protein
MLQILDKDTVTVRLILTVLQKLTIDSREVSEWLVENDFCDVLILLIEGSTLKFSVCYSTCILANLLQCESVREILNRKG